MRTIAEGINLKDSMSIEENLTKMRSAGKKKNFQESIKQGQSD